MKITKIKKIETLTLSYFDGQVMDLSPAEYKNLLEEIITSLEGRLECVKEESEDSE